MMKLEEVGDNTYMQLAYRETRLGSRPGKGWSL